MASYLDELNPAQRQAAEYGISSAGEPGGPLLIIAGAGTGKTNTLAYRVARLLECGADPRRILLLTFTRRAAEEMITRSQRILAKVALAGKSGNIPAGHGICPGTNNISWAGTFHSVGNRLLRIYAPSVGLDPSFTVMDRSDAEDLMNKVRHDLGFSKKEKRFPKKHTCYAIYSHAINSQQPVEKSLETDFPWCAEWAKDLKNLFRTYGAEKQKQNVLDYDDLLLYWYHLMCDKQAAEAVGKRFDFVLVDEYQDTNVLQAGILMNMKPAGRGLAVVGDDAQSIYSFRAATVRNILEFPRQFTPPAQVITLEQNYRSTQAILHCCNAVMDAATQRFTKNLFSARASAEKPFYACAEDESHQVAYVVKNVLEYREAGIPLTGQAVLFRAAHHSAELEVELGRRNIPFVKYGGLKFLEAAHVKDAICILRWAENPRDTLAAFRVLQLLEGVGPVVAEKVIAHLSSHEWNVESLPAFRMPPATVVEWPKFCGLMAALRSKNTAWPGQVGLVRAWYAPHLHRIYDSANIREHDIEQLEALSANFNDRETFLTELALDPPDATSDLAGVPLLDEDYLILSTIHSAKGKEWNVVYILNVSDGCIPSDMATGNAGQIEEERRLLYVAMTRARDHLHIIQPQRFFKYRHSHRNADAHVYATVSRFVTEEVLKRTERVFFGREHTSDDAAGSGDAGRIDVAGKIEKFWE